MKIIEKVFICALLVLMFSLCINACSAEETLNETLGADAIDDVILADAFSEELSASGDTFNVDTTGNGVDESPVGESQENVIYVSESGDDANDGSSEENAIATLSHAVEIVQARENKTATVYVLNGDYTSDAIDIGDDVGVSLSVIGQDKGCVIIHGTGAYIFDVYGDNLVWNFKNLDFDGLDSTARTSAALVLYSKNGNFTVDDCNFRNINAKLGAIAIGNDNGNTNVTNCIIEDITGSASSTSILTVNGDGKFILDNIEIKDCKLNENVAGSTVSSYLRSILYVNTYEADVTLSNSKIYDNNGPMMSLIESRAKLTIINTDIVNNVVNTSLNGANGGDVLIWASNDNSNINIAQSVISSNTIPKSGKGLFYNQRGSMNVEYSDLSKNTVDKFIGSTGTITANNNWWATNDQPDAKVDKWVIMNVESDDSDLSENNKITLTVDFNHVKTSSAAIESLTGGEIPKDFYTVFVSAQNGEITPTSVVVNKGEVKSEVFTVTEVNDVITLNCDGDVVELTVEGIKPYGGIIYVNKTGDNSNNGSIDAPVASISKAIELANAGSGQIVIDEGTYVGNRYHVTKSLNITGVGNVVLDANDARLFTMDYGDAAEQLVLTNLVITGADDGYGQAIYSFADELILDNVNITNNPGSGSLIKSYGKITVKDCIIANHNGDSVIDSSGSKDIIINNTVFENNTVTDNAIVYSSSSSGNAIVENTIFRNNTGQLGILKVSKKTTVKNSKFIDNTNKMGSGGAINDFDTLTVTNSTFINNKANKNSGAINVGYNRIATITHSTFINNIAGNGYHGNIISNDGKLTVNYCLLLSDNSTDLIYNGEYAQFANAQFNWWGSNDNPQDLVISREGEIDDWGDYVEGALVDTSNWVVMDVTTDMVDDTVLVGDTVEITVDFNNYIDSSNVTQPLAEKIPEVNVSASAVYGDLDADVKTTADGIAEFVYEATVSAGDTVNITSSNASVIIPINVDVSGESGIIYVSPNGNDSNDGLTKKHAVKTIAHAIEIATQGQIVLLTGVHTTDDLGGIYADLNITGEGKAIIDADNNNRILYVGSEANVVIRNVIMINGYTTDESGALLGNSNKLTLINCILANSSAGQNNGGAIFNVGKLTLINTTIANCSAKQGGAIFSQSDDDNVALEVINSTFENNIATGYDMNGGGAIYAQRSNAFYNFDLKVENSTFLNNKAIGTSSGGAIALVQLDATAKITDSKFIKNHANGKQGYGGGAIYVSGASNYYKYGTMTVMGSLFENNTCGENGGAIYGRVTTINVASSVLINNTDANGLAVYGHKSDSASPTITLNDNWWGSNDSPKGLTGGNNGYKPTLNRWAILTADNDSAIEAGSTVELTASLTDYTTGSQNGTMSKPITVKRDVTIKSTDGEIYGALENGEFVYDYTVPENIRYLAVTVDDETVELLVISSNVIVEVDDIAAKKYDKVNVVINVTSESEVNAGVIELYADTTLIDIIPVSHGKAIRDVVISSDIGTYELTAKFVDESGLFDSNQSSATLTVAGICELVNETFFNFFDLNGVLREEIDEDELVFHGAFSDLGVDTITINRPITVSGDNAVLYDMAFSLDCEDITLSNISLIANGVAFSENNGALISVKREGIEINKVIVNFTATSDKESFAIYAGSAEGFKLIDSEIYFDGNNNVELVHQAALIISGSDNVEIRGNLINAALPARNVAYNYYYPELVGIYQDLVLGIGIQDGSNINFIENEVIVDAKTAEGTYATLDSFMADSTENLVIKGNNFTQTDFTGVGKAGYANVIDLYTFTGAIVEGNNILVNTTTGEEGLGTAYPVQTTGPYTGLLITNNNLTSISKGPALGIYSQNYDGITDVEITFNNINVTGYATYDEYALVSGMELQDTYAKVYNNTVYSQSISAYNDFNKLFGISYAQYTALDHTYDIRDNTIFTEGKFAVYLRSAKDSNVTDNYLVANVLKGDASVNISGENNVVRDNLPGDSVATIVYINGTTITDGDNATVKVLLTQEDGSIISAPVVVNVNGVNVTAVTTSDDWLDVVINAGDLVLGINNVTVYYDGDRTHNASNATATVTVEKNKKVTADVEIEDVVYGDSAVIQVTNLQDAYGKKLSVYGGYQLVGPTTPYGVISVSKGKGTAKLGILPAGNYSAYIVFGNNVGGDYDFENYIVNFTVFKAPVNLTASVDDYDYGTTGNLNVKVMDTKNKAISGSINVTIDGAIYLSDVAIDGESNITLENVDLYNHTVEITFDSDNYIQTTTAVTLNVVYKTYLNASDLVMRYMDGSSWNVTLTDADGVAIAGAVVKVTIGGNTFELETDADGVAGLVINLVPDSYVVNARFEGNETYESSFVNATVTVGKATPTLSADDLEMVYKDGSSWNVTLTDADGVAIAGAVVKVGININGVDKIYSHVTDADGVIGLPINLGVGTYAVNATFEGNETYESSFVNATVTVGKATPTLSADDLEMRYKDGSSWNVTLTGANGAAIAGAIVKVTIADNTYNLKTDAYGVAGLSINLVPGSYAVNATFGGNRYYESSVVNATVTVGKAAVTLSADDLVMSYKDGSSWNVTLTDAEGNTISGVKVTFSVAGQTYNIKTDANGVAKLPINLPPGTYTVNASLKNSKYEAESITATVTINKLVPVLSAEDLVMEYKDGSSWSVTLTDADGNPLVNTYVKFTIADKSYNRKTNADGVASLPINLAIGNYTISAEFAGNATMEAVSINRTVVVNQPEYDLVGEDINMRYKDGTSYNVQLTDTNGNPVAKAGVVIKMTVAGKSYNRKTNADGIASLPIGLKSGSYEITAECNGKEITNTIVVNKA